MAVTLEVYRERRVVPIRFKRAINSGNPVRTHPDVDDRGSRSNERSEIISTSTGSEIFVRMIRVLIDNAADLFVTSSDATALQVVTPADGRVPAGAQADLKIKALRGGGASPVTADLEVRFGASTGPILHTLRVHCFTDRQIALTPHLVTIAQSGGGAAAVPSTANVAAIVALVREIWAPMGITFQVGATINDNVTFATAGILSDSPFPGEIVTLLGTNWVPNTINAYFINQIGTGGTLGYGFSRPSSVTFGTGNPGIILGDQTANGSVHDTMWAANDLAHEIGHFLQLWHPGNLQPPNEREDTWARRMLMHNFNHMRGLGNWKDDVGYGNRNRGCMVTHKDLPTISTDGETAIARGAALAGPY